MINAVYPDVIAHYAALAFLMASSLLILIFSHRYELRSMVFVAGGLVGVAFFFEIGAVFLVIAGFYFFWGKGTKRSRKLGDTCFFIVGFLGGFVGLIFREAMNKGNFITDSLATWLRAASNRFSLMNANPSEGLWQLIALAVFLCLLLPRCKNRRQATFTYETAAQSASSSAVSPGATSTNAGASIGAVAATVSTATTPTASASTATSPKTPATAAIQPPKPASYASSYDDSISHTTNQLTINSYNSERYDTSTGTKYLENPLPLPRKPEPRTLDYTYQVPPDKMYYGYRVADDDDFPLK